MTKKAHSTHSHNAKSQQRSDTQTKEANKKEDGTNDLHESYGCAVYKDGKKQWFEGEDHAAQMMKWIGNDVQKVTKRFKELKKYQVMLLAHNLSYDIRFMLDRIGVRGILQKGSRTLTCSGIYNHLGNTIEIFLKDTACLIPSRLAEFGKMFKLPVEKM